MSRETETNGSVCVLLSGRRPSPPVDGAVNVVVVDRGERLIVYLVKTRRLNLSISSSIELLDRVGWCGPDLHHCV